MRIVGLQARPRSACRAFSQFALWQRVQCSRVARERLMQVIQKVADPAAAIKAATDICAEAIAAVRVYRANRK
jgi:hypothetical protein